MISSAEDQYGINQQQLNNEKVCSIDEYKFVIGSLFKQDKCSSKRKKSSIRNISLSAVWKMHCFVIWLLSGKKDFFSL